MPFWSSDVPATISENIYHPSRPKPELVQTGVVSVASADLCQATATTKLEAAFVSREEQKTLTNSSPVADLLWNFISSSAIPPSLTLDKDYFITLLCRS